MRFNNGKGLISTDSTPIGSRRGQVTLFVILGIVLLILVLLFLFVKHKPSAPIQTPVMFRPVEDLFTNCIDSSLEQLLREAGANGGYLDTSTLHHDLNTKKSDTVSFPPQDVPFWSHLKPCKGGLCEASEQPPLCREGADTCPIQSVGQNSIQEQIESALPERVMECFNSSNLLTDQFLVKQEGDSSATLLFSSKKVFATLNLPMKVTDLATGQTASLKEFNGEVDVALPRLYLLANKIANAERQTNFLERLTLDLISIYSGVNEELPPMRDITLLGQKRYWSRTRVEQLLQDEVLIWTDFIQIPEAGGFAPVWPSKKEGLSDEEQRLYAGVFSYLDVHLGNQTYPDIKVNFFYPGTRPYLSINGGQELLSPRSADTGGLLQKLVGVFINDYRFFYDLTFPVIVNLKEPQAFDGKGYTFSFALQSNIMHNQPVNKTATVDNFRIINERVDFSSPQQRVDNTIKIKSIDRHTGEPLAGTRISYRCGSDYFIGETDNDGELVSRMPFCRYGGVILYSKAGYLGSGIEYDNYQEGVLRNFTVALWPLENVTFTVRKRTAKQVEELDSGGVTYKQLKNKSSRLSKHDLFLFSVKRIKETPYDEESPMIGFFSLAVEQQNFTTKVNKTRAELDRLVEKGVLTQEDSDELFASINNSNGKELAPPEPSVKLQLAPGKYVVEGQLLKNKDIVIPEEKKEFCIVGGGSTCIGKKQVTLNSTELSMWLSGGIALNSSNPYQLGENILYRHSNYTFYALEQKIPSSWSDLEHFESVDDFLDDKRILMLPTFG